MDPLQLQQFNSLGIKTIPKAKPNIVPLLSISGITILSFGGLLLLKNDSSKTVIQPAPKPINQPNNEVKPTQVPKSIQHYLLTSQQFFSEAINRQKTENVAPFINQAISTVSTAIQEFPEDPRGWEFRAKIYQSLIPSQPQYLSVAITDFQQAANLNPTNSETLYSLTRLQEQSGNLPEALRNCYKLLSLVTSPTEHQQVTTEIQSLRQLISQNKSISPPETSTAVPTPQVQLEGNLIQALSDSSLIIAAPETSTNSITSSSLDTNALSGNSVLPAGKKSISLTSTGLKSTSQVYLTITKGGKNQNLQVLSRSTDSFTVGLDSPITEDIKFKWWIVN